MIVELDVFLRADIPLKILQHVCCALKLGSDCFAECLLTCASLPPVILGDICLPQMRDAVVVLGASFLAQVFVYRLPQSNTHIAEFSIR